MKPSKSYALDSTGLFMSITNNILAPIWKIFLNEMPSLVLGYKSDIGIQVLLDISREEAILLGVLRAN